MCGPTGHLGLGPKLTKLKVRFALVRTEANREVAVVLNRSDHPNASIANVQAEQRSVSPQFCVMSAI